MNALPDRLAGYRHLQLHPMTGVLGAEITGVDLVDAPDAAIEEIRRALAENLVITFPQQSLSDIEHLRLSERLGTHLRMPQVQGLPGMEDLQPIKRDADATGRVIGEAWHADSTFMKTPPAAVAMRAIDIPDFGGDTGFASMYAAYDALSPRMQDMLEGLRAVHSGTKVYGSIYKQASGKKFDHNLNTLNEEMADRECVHPVVCTHPVSGRKHLFVNGSFTLRFEGMTEEESKPLLEFLYKTATRFEFTCRIRWRKGLLLMWDNRASMHTAISDYAGKGRYMLRTTLAGQAPRLN